MKSKKLVSRLMLIMFLFLLGSCAQGGVVPGTSPRIGTPMVTGTTVLNPISTLVPASTATHLPTATAIPTLPVEIARLKFLNLLANNGDCRLPCLWGITPGESTFQEAQAILVPLSNISNRANLESSPGFIGLNYTEGDIRINTSIAFLADPTTSVVSSISFHAQALSEISQDDVARFGDALYDRLMKTYSLPQILTIYGPPVDVLIRTNSKLPPQIWGPFEMLLSYPELGVLVHYTMSMNPVGANIVGCPAKSKLDLDLEPSGSFTSTEELMAFEAAPLKIEEIFPGYRPIEEVTSLSLINFVKIFSQPTEQCIETPARYWPEP